MGHFVERDFLQVKDAYELTHPTVPHCLHDNPLQRVESPLHDFLEITIVYTISNIPAANWGVDDGVAFKVRSEDLDCEVIR